MNTRNMVTNQGSEQALRQMLASFGDLRFAVLATSGEGRPYASLIAFTFTPDQQKVIFATPKTTRKYRNLKGQPLVSILVDNRSQTPEDLNRAEAVTLIGTAKPIRSGTRRNKYAGIFTAKHPQLIGFINEPDTALIEVIIEEAVHVTRFQHVSTWAKGNSHG
ncbi:MAG: flavin-nucleotide-binding protein [Syntrophus sp. (in: bacteria)]|nr:flavin-nucleotide-binding protein [Syntrophus sp. (in: bacteria)]